MKRLFSLFFAAILATGILHAQYGPTPTFLPTLGGGGGGGMAIGSIVTGATPGSVFFADGSGNLGQDNANFFWSTANKSLMIGPVAPFSNTLLQIAGSANSFLQTNIQNTSTGVSASSDYVATADTGTQTTNFIDMGINNSGFTDSTFTITGALGGYLYTQSSALAIGTASANPIQFFVGGTLAANEVMRITSAGVLQVTGSGVINATQLSGKTFAIPAAIGSTTPAAVTGTTVTATTQFTGPGTGLTGVPWASLASGTNTTAAAVVGTGASLSASGTGSINATQLNGATFAAPGAIGGTTQSTGQFTTVTATQFTSPSGSPVTISAPVGQNVNVSGAEVLGNGGTSQQGFNVNPSSSGLGFIDFANDTTAAAAAANHYRQQADANGFPEYTGSAGTATRFGWVFLGSATGSTVTVGPITWSGTFQQLMFVYKIVGYNGGTPVGRLQIGSASISTTALDNSFSISEGVTAPTTGSGVTAIPGLPLAVTLSNIGRGGYGIIDGASGSVKTIIVEGFEAVPSVATAPVLFRGVSFFSDLTTNLPIQRAQLTVYDTLTAVTPSAQTFTAGTYLAVYGRNNN